MKKALVILGIFIAIVAILAIGKDFFIKSAVKVAVTKLTGAPVEIDSFSLGVVNHSVNIKGFKLYNPQGFGQEVLVNVSEVKVDCDLPALLKKKIHLNRLAVDLKEICLIKNKDGQLNVDSLKVAQDREDPSDEKTGRSSEMPMQIDVVELNIGKIVYKDYSVKGEPLVKVYEVGIKNKVYKNITSARQLSLLILTEPMKAAGIKGAGIYGAATLLGVGFLPVGVAGILVGKDDAQAEFSLEYEEVYTVSKEVLQKMGSVLKENKIQGVINGKVKGCKVIVKIEKERDKIQVNVSARKLMLPKPEIAGGIIHEISQRVKQD